MTYGPASTKLRLEGMPTPASILVVDDDEAVRLLLTRRLEKSGFRVITAADGAEAIELLNTEAIDLVLLDTMMPNVNGHEVLKSVRRKHASTPLPIIMITALETGPDVIEALRLGANDYVTKPVDFELLFKRIAVHLALKTGKGYMLGDYRLLERVGAGGMGVVYAAIDVSSGARLAIKILRRAVTTDDQWVLRFLREARLASRLMRPSRTRTLFLMSSCEKPNLRHFRYSPRGASLQSKCAARPSCGTSHASSFSSTSSIRA